jgi:hypothetical protein
MTPTKEPSAVVERVIEICARLADMNDIQGVIGDYIRKNAMRHVMAERGDHDTAEPGLCPRTLEEEE